MSQQVPAGPLTRLFEGTATPPAAAQTWPAFNFSGGMVDDPAPAGLANRIARQLSLDPTGALRVNVVAGGAAAALVDEATIINAALVADGAATPSGATGVLGFLDAGLIIEADGDGTLDVELSSDDARFGFWQSVDILDITNERLVALGGLPLWAEHVRIRNRAGANRTVTVSVHRAR